MATDTIPPGGRLATAITDALSTKAKLFRGFADRSRLSLVEALRDGPRTVGELVERTGLTQPNTSNHLACLMDCGLIRREQRGRFVYYALSDARVAALLGDADELLTEVARGVEACGRYNAKKRRT